MRIVFMGTPSFSIPALEGLIENYNVVGVVSQPDKKVGRKQELVFSPVKQLALKHDIPVLQPEKISNDYEDVLSLKPDLIITCAYGQFIPDVILNYPKLGSINIHGSLLPKLRGGAPIHWAKINGEKETGITIMKMVKKMDAGDIISQKSIPILDDDTYVSLYEKLSIIGKELLLETLPIIIKGNYPSIKQDEQLVTLGLNVTSEDAFVDFNDSCLNIINKIHGLNPTPGAYGYLDGERIKFYHAQYLNDEINEAGIINDITKEGFVISCRDGLILITDLQLPGKRRMKINELYNGLNKENYINKVFKGE